MTMRLVAAKILVLREDLSIEVSTLFTELGRRTRFELLASSVSNTLRYYLGA